MYDVKQNSDGFYIGAHGCEYEFEGEAAFSLWVDQLCEPLWPLFLKDDGPHAALEAISEMSDYRGEFPSAEHERQAEKIREFCDMIDEACS